MKDWVYNAIMIMCAVSSVPFIILGLMYMTIIPMWGSAIFLAIALWVHNEWKKQKKEVADDE